MLLSSDTAEAVGRHREETRQLMFSFESKKSPSTLTSMHMMMDQLSAQGVGALNTSLPREAELRPLGRNRDFLKKKSTNNLQLLRVIIFL